eukprot:GHRR01001365.1.p1 GENE.GHRR01001365.1~~GHRR01001365.1.p1  ORF type:complete len:915 (+),score=385.62 GHRR01001365.1:1991-4735(+)
MPVTSLQDHLLLEGERRLNWNEFQTLHKGKLTKRECSAQWHAYKEQYNKTQTNGRKSRKHAIAVNNPNTLQPADRLDDMAAAKQTATPVNQMGSKAADGPPAAAGPGSNLSQVTADGMSTPLPGQIQHGSLTNSSTVAEHTPGQNSTLFNYTPVSPITPSTVGCSATGTPKSQQQLASRLTAVTLFAETPTTPASATLMSNGQPSVQAHKSCLTASPGASTVSAHSAAVLLAELKAAVQQLVTGQRSLQGQINYTDSMSGSAYVHGHNKDAAAAAPAADIISAQQTVQHPACQPSSSCIPPYKHRRAQQQCLDKFLKQHLEAAPASPDPSVGCFGGPAGQLTWNGFRKACAGQGLSRPALSAAWRQYKSTGSMPDFQHICWEADAVSQQQGHGRAHGRWTHIKEFLHSNISSRAVSQAVRRAVSRAVSRVVSPAATPRSSPGGQRKQQRQHTCQVPFVMPVYAGADSSSKQQHSQSQSHQHSIVVAGPAVDSSIVTVEATYSASTSGAAAVTASLGESAAAALAGQEGNALVSSGKLGATAAACAAVSSSYLDAQCHEHKTQQQELLQLQFTEAQHSHSAAQIAAAQTAAAEAAPAVARAAECPSSMSRSQGTAFSRSDCTCHNLNQGPLVAFTAYSTAAAADGPLSQPTPAAVHGDQVTAPGKWQWASTAQETASRLQLGTTAGTPTSHTQCKAWQMPKQTLLSAFIGSTSSGGSSSNNSSSQGNWRLLKAGEIAVAKGSSTSTISSTTDIKASGSVLNSNRVGSKAPSATRSPKPSNDLCISGRMPRECLADEYSGVLSGFSSWVPVTLQPGHLKQTKKAIPAKAGLYEWGVRWPANDPLPVDAAEAAAALSNGGAVKVRVHAEMVTAAKVQLADVSPWKGQADKCYGPVVGFYMGKAGMQGKDRRGFLVTG